MDSEIMVWTIEQIFCVKTYYDVKSFKIVYARYWKKLSSTQFQTGVRFLSWLRTLKLIAFVKIV